jgi:hypothetical protein
MLNDQLGISDFELFGKGHSILLVPLGEAQMPMPECINMGRWCKQFGVFVLFKDFQSQESFVL